MTCACNCGRTIKQPIMGRSRLYYGDHGRKASRDAYVARKRAGNANAGHRGGSAYVSELLRGLGRDTGSRDMRDVPLQSYGMNRTGVWF